MSFGFSIGDLACLITLTKKTYDRWRNAPKEFKDVVQTLNECNIILGHIHRRLGVFVVAGSEHIEQKEMGNLLQGCDGVISDLRKVVKQRRKLGHWDRIKLGASHIGECKDRLARHINMLTPLLLSLELESLGKDVSSLLAAIERLPQVLTHTLPIALGKMIDSKIEDSRTAKSPIMTTYGDDDKQAYRELRSHLISCGIKDTVVRKHKARLVEFMKMLTRDDGRPTAHSSDRTTNTGPSGSATSISCPDLQPISPACTAGNAKPVKDPASGRGQSGTSTGDTARNRDYQVSVETDNEDECESNPMRGSIDGPLMELCDEMHCQTSKGVPSGELKRGVEISEPLLRCGAQHPEYLDKDNSSNLGGVDLNDGALHQPSRDRSPQARGRPRSRKKIRHLKREDDYAPGQSHHHLRGETERKLRESGREVPNPTHMMHHDILSTMVHHGRQIRAYPRHLDRLLASAGNVSQPHSYPDTVTQLMLIHTTFFVVAHLVPGQIRRLLMITNGMTFQDIWMALKRNRNLLTS